VRGRVGRERRALQRLVHARIETDRLDGREGLGVAEGGADRVVAGERVDVVLRQVHHGAEIAEQLIGGVRVEEDIVVEQVDVGGCGCVSHGVLVIESVAAWCAASLDDK